MENCPFAFGYNFVVSIKTVNRLPHKIKILRSKTYAVSHSENQKNCRHDCLLMLKNAGYLRKKKTSFADVFRIFMLVLY